MAHTNVAADSEGASLHVQQLKQFLIKYLLLLKRPVSHKVALFVVGMQCL
jgi:hypothetical protein